jgi:DnaJ-domain-containing protein 1
MGISVHFSGQIECDQIIPLCDELEDIACSVGFDDSLPVDDADKRLRGIILRPDSEMESIPFLFDSEGRMHALGDLIAGWDDYPILSVAVKTQFAEVTDHIWLVELLRYIRGKYIPAMEVMDEGGYWEQKDPEELKRRLDELGAMIKGLGQALEEASMDTVVDKNNPEALADFVQRIAQAFQDRRTQDDD